MEIQRTALRDLQDLQEDMAQYFCDHFGVSGETYWTCVESVAQVKLMEVTGEVKFDYDDLQKFKEEYTEENWLFVSKKSQKKVGQFFDKIPFSKIWHII